MKNKLFEVFFEGILFFTFIILKNTLNFFSLKSKLT